MTFETGYIIIASIAFIGYAVQGKWETCIWIANSIIWASR